MDFTRRRDYVDGEFHIFFLDGEEFILIFINVWFSTHQACFLNVE
jgi:hypothetical protein